VPALDALQDRFEAAHTQVVGISIDSVYSHANWANSLGGISLPLLADFHPKGAVAEKFGLYLADDGITDRATVVIDADGVVQHVSSVGPSGSRDIDELARLAEEIDGKYAGDLPTKAEPQGVKESTLYVKSKCGFSRSALLARSNLGLDEFVGVRNIDEDDDARAELKKLAGKEQAPCLVEDGSALFESADIIKKWVSEATGLS
jgi:glutaredoxin-related protein